MCDYGTSVYSLYVVLQSKFVDIRELEHNWYTMSYLRVEICRNVTHSHASEG